MNLCANGRELISEEEMCNGFYDCQDQSDEAPGCGKSLTCLHSGNIPI